MFATNENNNSFQEGDFVVFRAENKQNMKVAYFVNKITPVNKKTVNK